MEKDKHETKVLFRLWNIDGETELIALFPEIVADRNYKNCQSFQHIGQHSAARLDFILENSKPATENQYKELFNELENDYGYNLRVIARNSVIYTRKRLAETAKL